MKTPEIKREIEAALGMGEIPDDTPVEEVLAWMEAKREDLVEGMRKDQMRRDQVYRDNGFLAPGDLEAILKAMSAGGDLTVDALIARLNRKKRRGKRDQAVVDLWNRHYAGRKCYLPDGETVDRLERIADTKAAKAGG